MAIKINGKRVAMSVISRFTPTGKKIVTENGTYDITNFAEVEVDVPTPEQSSVCMQKTVTISGDKSSGNYTWLTQQDLVDAGLLSNTSENLYNKYSDLYVEILMQSNTHTTNQIVMQRSSKSGFNYSGTSKYYKNCYKHGNSTTAVSASQSNALMTTSTTGFCSYSTANGLYSALSSSYKLLNNSEFLVTLVAIK